MRAGMLTERRDALMADLRVVGVIAEACLGCGKIDCGGCPAGTGTVIDDSKLEPAAAAELENLRGRWEGDEGDWRDHLVMDLLASGVVTIEHGDYWVTLDALSPAVGRAYVAHLVSTARSVPSQSAPARSVLLDEAIALLEEAAGGHHEDPECEKHEPGGQACLLCRMKRLKKKAEKAQLRYVADRAHMAYDYVELHGGRALTARGVDSKVVRLIIQLTLQFLGKEAR